MKIKKRLDGKGREIASLKAEKDKEMKEKDQEIDELKKRLEAIEKMLKK